MQSAKIIDGNWVSAERLALIRQQRLEAAKKREEEKAGKFVSNLSMFLYIILFCIYSYRFVHYQTGLQGPQTAKIKLVCRFLLSKID